jgi:predicted permease
MITLRSLTHGIRALLHRNDRNAEIAEELRSFEDASVEEKMRSGMSREAASRAARAEAGSAETVRHKVWSAGWESAADSLRLDLRYGVRQILRSPGFSIVAILSLALGIGANTAIFTLMNDLLLKQLPVRDPQQLVSFGDGSSNGAMESSGPGPYDIFPYEFYRLTAERQNQFQGICAFASFHTAVSVRAGSAGSATRAIGHLVSSTFFNVLGAEPLLGRTFIAEDVAVAGRTPVVVISHRYWQQELAADPSVIGRDLTINGTQFTVIGVMPARFYGVDLNEQPSDMWLPITMQQEVMLQPSLLAPDGLFWIHIMARRKTGVSVAEAQSWVTAQFQRFLVDRSGARITGDRRRQISESFVPLLPGGSGLSHLRSAYQAPLTVLMVMVGVVLLIACANLANLLLAKAASREREFSARLALGSSRGRIIRQVLTESLVLAFGGGALGLGLAFWATRVLIRFIDRGATHTALTATPDLHVLAFTSAICVLTGVLFGIAPAWRGSRSSLAGALNARTATGAAGLSARLLPRMLVVAQVTLSLVLLAVAGLLLRTLHNLRTEDLGFNRNNTLLVTTNPKFAGYKPEQLNALYDRILDRVDALPGVRISTLSGAPPMSRGTWGSPISIDGHPYAPNDDVSTLLNRVSPGFFETMGITLVRGRTIGAEDTASSAKAVVVNQTLADRYFPKGDAIGHSFKVADPAVIGTWQIVGIVRDAKYNSPAEKPKPFAYLALAQLTGDAQYAYNLQIRTVGDPAKITGEVRAALAGIDGNLPLLEIRTVAEDVNHLTDEQQFISQLSGFFSLLALSLACVGLYGVMTYNVVRRTHEIGVRMALGAPKGGVLWMVLKESLLLLVIGLALGVPAALAANHVIRAGLFGVSPSDPLTLVVAVLVLAVVILGAAYLPARRATQVDPMVALRYE